MIVSEVSAGVENQMALPSEPIPEPMAEAPAVPENTAREQPEETPEIREVSEPEVKSPQDDTDTQTTDPDSSTVSTDSMPLTDWQKFIRKRTAGFHVSNFTEPTVIIEFSENENFSDYEELTFTQADRKFKEVEAKARAERIEKYGSLGGYDKTSGVILYKDSPEDTELSTYEFRYDICDYDEKESGLFNHISGFWDYQEKKIQQGEFTGYTQESVDNVKRMLSYLQPYAAQSRDIRLQEYFDKFPPHKETRPVGERVLLPLLFEGGIIPIYMQMKALGLTGSLWSVVLASAMNIFYMIIMRNYFSSLP